MKNFDYRSFLQSQLLPVVLFTAAVVGLSHLSWIRGIESSTVDLRVKLRAELQDPPDDRLLIVGIDDDALATFGRWPWSREVHGLFTALTSFGKPSVLAWDILFTESSDQDNKLIVGTQQLGDRVIYGAYGSTDDPNFGEPAPDFPTLTAPLTHIEGDLSKLPAVPFALLPVPPLRAIALSAFVDTPPGFDGVRRWVPLLQNWNGKVYPSLSLQSLIRYWDLGPDDVRIVLGEAIYLGGEAHRRIPIDAAGKYFINYRFDVEIGRQAKILTSYKAMLLGYNAHYVAHDTSQDLVPVEGRIVLVGQMSTGLSDNGRTPFSPETPLVLVHANVINNVLQEDYVTWINRTPVAIGMALLGLFGLVYFPSRTLRTQLLYAVGVPVLYVCIGTLAWLYLSWRLPLLWPILGFVGTQVYMIWRQVIREQRQKAQIKGMFGSYVAPALVERMVASGQSPQLGGHDANITAYFSDIQSFSTFSEQLPPDRLVDLMNEYLTICTDIIQEEGGTLDKYIGDAVVAMFGAPLALDDHAFRACVATQRVHVALLQLRAKWKEEDKGWPEIVFKMQSRIGLNSGNVVVGNMGSRTRFNYTMMGDNVNLAARLESGGKSWGVYTMCSEATKADCEKFGGDRVVFRALGSIVVQGRTKAVPIYEIVGLKENVSDQTRECIRIFELGLQAHNEQAWDKARGHFHQSEPLEPNQPGKTPGVKDNPSRIYLRIVDDYEAHPPPAGWTGEFIMKTK